MYMRFLIGLFLIFNLGACKGAAQDLVIVNNNLSIYKIIIPADASKLEIKSANVLQDYILKVTGVQLPIGNEKKEPLKTPGIYLGYTAKKEIAYRGKMPPESYKLTTDGKDLIICGGSGKGLIYGVYFFIENYLHCRKLAGEPAFIYVSTEVTIPGRINDFHKPDFIYREVYYPASNDPEYLEWHQLQQLDDLWGLWGHTFNKLLPAETYFKTHPEYYALVKGVRQPSQPDLSNEEVFRIITAELRKRMAAHPDAMYWSISPNDDNGYCECNLCKAVYNENGGPSGSLIKFVNRIAAAFPDKSFTTLAYGYTHKAPTSLKPAKNVYVFLSDIDALRDKPLSEEATAATFRKDLKAWGGITPNIFVWDYITQFTNYLAPFPNLHTLKANMQFFKDNGVKGVFAQGSGTTFSEWAELKSYLMAKVFEDTKVEITELTNSFIDYYYGSAAPYLQQYQDLLQSKMLETHRHLDIYGNPINEWSTYLSPEQLDLMSSLMDKAEAATEGKPQTQQRVMRARLPLEYTVLQQARFYGIEKHGIWVKDKNGEYSLKSKFAEKVSRFVANCKKAGVTELSEGGLTPDQYQAEWNNIIKTGVTKTIALGAKLTLQYPYAEDYPAKANRTLTDGNPGYNDFSYNWLCFYGTPMVATIDLGKKTTVNTVKMHFLDDPRHFIFQPEKITVETSEDGTSWHPFGDYKPAPNTEHFEVGVKEYSSNASGKNAQARFLRVTATNLTILPAWRYRDNKKPMIACDEIYVQ